MDKRLDFGQIILRVFLCLIIPIVLSCEDRKNSALSSKSNSPPTVTSVTLLPEKAYKGTEFNLVVQGSDPDGDPITYKYQWIKNEQEMVGENKSSLRPDRFQKGDLIQAKVTPTDGKSEGHPFLSAPVKILNSAPVIQEVWVEPKLAFAGDSLKAQVKGADLDGDFVYYTFQWEKEGRVISDEKNQVLERGRFKKGDSIAITVIPDDREVQGEPKKSDPVLILNSPPMIVSSPPTSVDGTTYRYLARANDPDGDPIVFTLKSGPKGMVIDKDKGLIRWEIKKEDKGTHSILSLSALRLFMCLLCLNFGVSCQRLSITVKH
jgi:hypothetical protein